MAILLNTSSDDTQPKISTTKANSAIGSYYSSPVLGAAQIAASVYNNAQNIKAQKEINASNQEFQKEVNADNMAFQREQFDYQKYLNENQYQLTMSDMQKAGLNPMLANGVNLSAGNFNSTSQATQGKAPYSDISPILAVIQQAIGLSEQSRQNYYDRLSAEKIASEKNASEEKIAEENRKTQQLIASNSISAENQRFAQQLAFTKDEAEKDRLLKKQLEERGLSAKETANAIESLKNNRDYQLAIQKIVQEQEKIDNAKDASERQVAEESKRTWTTFAASIFNTVVNGATSVFSTVSNKGKGIK